MSAWDLCGIGIVARRGLCGGGGGIAGIPSASDSRRDSGPAIASSTSSRSTSPVTARIRPSAPTRDSWKSTRSRRRMRRTRSAPPFGSRPYGWSFGNTKRASSRAALEAVSSASMRRSFRSSPRTRSISRCGNVGWERQSTRIRIVSRRESRVHRPLKPRTSSPLWNSRVAPIPSSRSASFAAPRRRVPLRRSRDANSATPCASPSAATPAGTLPRNATNGFDGRALEIRTAPFPRAVRSGSFSPFPPGRGIGRGTDVRPRGTFGRRPGCARRGLSRPSSRGGLRSPRTRCLLPR